MKAADGPDLRSIWLAAGAHPAPRRGVCVVELASMLAREEFSDRPHCVCPVIGAFLRGLNDRLAYFDRQFLIPYAELIVGSRAGRRLTRERRRMCLDWAIGAARRGPLSAAFARLRARVGIALRSGPVAAVRISEGIGDHAARVAIARGDDEAGFELLERLLATVVAPEPEPRVQRTAAAGWAVTEQHGSQAAAARRFTAPGTGRFRVPAGELGGDRSEPVCV
ncbi:MAG: hypothetical protein ACRDKX_00535 [Solirubrobacterales bacterium]